MANVLSMYGKGIQTRLNEPVQHYESLLERVVEIFKPHLELHPTITEFSESNLVKVSIPLSKSDKGIYVVNSIDMLTQKKDEVYMKTNIAYDKKMIHSHPEIVESIKDILNEVYDPRLSQKIKIREEDKINDKHFEVYNHFNIFKSYKN